MNGIPDIGTFTIVSIVHVHLKTIEVFEFKVVSSNWRIEFRFHDWIINGTILRKSEASVRERFLSMTIGVRSIRRFARCVGFLKHRYIFNRRSGLKSKLTKCFYFSQIFILSVCNSFGRYVRYGWMKTQLVNFATRLSTLNTNSEESINPNVDTNRSNSTTSLLSCQASTSIREQVACFLYLHSSNARENIEYTL